MSMRARLKRRAGYEGLRKLVRGLREVASGAVLATTIVRVGRYLRGRVKGELARHVKTGTALRTATVAPSTKSISLTLQHYRRYIDWSFQKGIPITAIHRAKKILGDEVKKALGGGS
jgi:hypothetical protein